MSGEYTTINLGSVNALLPLPNTLSYQSDYKWETVELGAVGHMYANNPSFDNLMDGASDFADNFIKATHRAAAANDSAIANQYSIAQGISPNPKEAIMFKGVTFRTYSLEFTITGPDAASVKKKAEFVNQLHVEAAPTLEGKKFFWKYPPSGTLSIKGPNGIVILPPRDIYITSIATDLNPGGGFFATYEGGAPVQFSLTIGIIEKALPSKENDANLMKL